MQHRKGLPLHLHVPGMGIPQEYLQQFFTGGNKADDGAYGDPHASDTGFPPHNLGVDSYSCQWFHGALHNYIFS